MFDTVKQLSKLPCVSISGEEADISPFQEPIKKSRKSRGISKKDLQAIEDIIKLDEEYETYNIKYF